MLIQEGFTVEAPRDEVAAFLLAVERVSACVPGVDDVRAVGENTYEATLRVQLGPIRSEFTGSVEVDAARSPEQLAAFAQGRDRSTGSQARVNFTAELQETPTGHTDVSCRADVTIRGRLGQFGTGVINSTAKEIIRDFARCASETLAQAQRPEPDTATVRPPEQRPLRMGRLVGRGLLQYVRTLLARLAAWFRRRRGARGANEER